MSHSRWAEAPTLSGDPGLLSRPFGAPSKHACGCEDGVSQAPLPRPGPQDTLPLPPSVGLGGKVRAGGGAHTPARMITEGTPVVPESRQALLFTCCQGLQGWEWGPGSPSGGPHPWRWHLPLWLTLLTGGSVQAGESRHQAPGAFLPRDGGPCGLQRYCCPSSVSKRQRAQPLHRDRFGNSVPQGLSRRTYRPKA